MTSHTRARGYISLRRTRMRVAGWITAIALALAGSFAPALIAVAPAGATPTSGTIYVPNTGTNPNEDASYPRVIRLANSGSANGTVLATFSHSGVGTTPANFPIYKSTNGGATWSSSPIGTVTASASRFAVSNTVMAVDASVGP